MFQKIPGFLCDQGPWKNKLVRLFIFKILTRYFTSVSEKRTMATVTLLPPLFNR